MKTTLTIEQSARLIKLGVDKNLASRNNHDVDVYGNKIDEYRFCLTDLLRILPKKITDRRDIYNLNIGVNSEDLWYAKYLNDHECWDSLNSYQDAHELCDCIYDMIVWLKEKTELKWL